MFGSSRKTHDSQQGNSLVEAVVAIALVGLVAQGAVLMNARAADTQGQIHTQESAISQMRALLVNNGTGAIDLCSGSLPDIDLSHDTTTPLRVQGCSATTTAAIGDLTITDLPHPLILSINHDLVGGQMVIGGTWSYE